ERARASRSSRHPERSRGIPPRNLKAHFNGIPRLTLGMTEFCRSGLERPAKILEPIESFLDYIDACGVAKPNGAIVAEGGTRHDRDIRFTQQAIGKILRGQPELADIHQHVKGASRFDRGPVRNLGNSIKHVVAAHIEFISHVRNW